MSDLPVSQRALDCAADVSGCGTLTNAKIRAGKLNKMSVVMRIAAFERDCTAPLEAENARLQDILDTERYKVAIGVQEIARAVQGRKWLSEPGRGSYTYDDERYQAEFGAALDEIYAALKPLQAIAQDWSDCPRDPLRVASNRAAALQHGDSNDGE